jgi:NAD(P)-dependent dehydrogenase (short-subunit alcohol dehydrogenase family)
VDIVNQRRLVMGTVLITGGHSGIGREAAGQLASRGVDLVLAGRSPERMRSVADELGTAYGVQVRTLELDVSTSASVRRASARCASMVEEGEIDALQAILCNAGGRFDGDERYTPDGYELTFATNCLGHFLLVELLLPSLATDGRVVFTASGTHDPDTMDGRLVGAAVEPDAIALANDGKDGAKPLSAGKRYSTSKLCTVMYAYELARRLEMAGSSIVSIAFDPGSVPETGLLRGMPGPVRWLSRTSLLRWLMRRVGVTTSTLAVSGASLADVAVEPRFSTGSGEYFQAEMGSLTSVRSSKASYNRESASKLWEDTKTLVDLAPEEEPASLR